MAVTGLLLIGFVVVHMLGNLQIFQGQEKLNGYAYMLQHLGPVLWGFRLGLLALLTIHILSAAFLYVENQSSRINTYTIVSYKEADLPARTMMISGIVITAFVFYHILHFTLGVVQPQYYHLPLPAGGYDVYSMMVLGYKNVWVSAIYVASMALLCFHLAHAFQSFLQTLGLNNTDTKPLLKRVSVALSIVVFIGNCSIPVSCLLGLISIPSGGVTP